MVSKEFIFDHPREIGWLLKIYNAFNIHNKIRKKKNNRIKSKAVLMKGVEITINGYGNSINIGDFSRLIGMKIYKWK